MSLKHALFAVLVASLMGSAACRCCKSDSEKSATKPVTPATKTAASDADETILSLFDGKTLGSWKSSEFGGDGEIKVENGQIVVGAGATCSGVTWKGKALPKLDYEVELDAMKVSGDDFFLALTFPYKEAAATFVCGGWGGSLVGISSVDGYDAANNDTAKNLDFKKNKWYHIRVKCTRDKIEAWVDDEQLVDLTTTDHKIDTRIDIDNAKPMGLSTYQTVGAYKNIVIRKLQ